MPVSLLPSWAQEGGSQSILARLRKPDDRRKIAAEIESTVTYLPDMVFTYLKETPELDGSRLGTIAKQMGRSMGDALCEVLLQHDLMVGYLQAPPEDNAIWQQLNRDFMELIARPDYMVCSDITPAGTHPHPRCYGAFPRFLGRLRREVGGLSLEAMVHRMTDRTAMRFGLAHRGRIEKGYHADIAIFNADTVTDTATYDKPRQFPVGIPYVIVNGQVAVDNERLTGVFAGEAIP
jgi:N-acyl-D-amino-acid deacylase